MGGKKHAAISSLQTITEPMITEPMSDAIKTALTLRGLIRWRGNLGEKSESKWQSAPDAISEALSTAVRLLLEHEIQADALANLHREVGELKLELAALRAGAIKTPTGGCTCESLAAAESRIEELEERAELKGKVGPVTKWNLGLERLNKAACEGGREAGHDAELEADKAANGPSTPLTDSVELRTTTDCVLPQFVVDADVCRELEIENLGLKARGEELEREHAQLTENNSILKDRCDIYKEEVEELDREMTLLVQRIANLERENTELRESLGYLTEHALNQSAELASKHPITVGDRDYLRLLAEDTATAKVLLARKETKP